MKNTFYVTMMTLCCIMLFTVTNANACPPSGEKADAAIENTDGQSETFRFVSMDMSVSDMTCMGCENKVKAALGQIDGIVSTKKVCSQSDVASVSYDPEVTTQEEIMSQLSEKTGYKVAIIKNAAMDGEASSGDLSKATCAADCQKACCADGKGKKQCTAAQKAACDKAKAVKLENESIQPE